MKTVLIVDDEFGLAEALAALLADEGYRVVLAANGRQGLERMAQERPDLVLVDYMMPVMNGAEMLLALRADAGFKAIPAILMSGVPESMLRCNGHDAFLRKPFDGEALLALVARLVATR